MREREEQNYKHAKVLRKNMTEAEDLLWYDLRKKLLSGHKFRRQHRIENYIVDFACVKSKFIVEVDGATHSTDEEIKYDRKRTVFLESKGWKVLRFSNDDIYKDREVVLDTIYLHLPSTE